MIINVYPFTCAKAGVPVMDAFIKGLKNEQVKIFNTPTIETCDVAVIWSMLWTKPQRKLIYYAYRKKGIPVIILEVGALKRNHLWKLGINSINNNAIWANENSPADRWTTFNIDLKPWKQGQDIIICGQNKQSAEWNNGNMEDYISKTITEIRKYSNRKIIVRPHPRAGLKLLKLNNVEIQKPKHIGNYDDYDFKQQLKNAWAVVSYNSNPGIEAIINGVPVFCHKSSLVSSVGNLNLADIEKPIMPDRTQWANNIAYTEWSIKEIETGIPWKRLKSILMKSNHL